MLYAIVGTDVPNSLARRMAARPDPCPTGYTGSLIVAEFESLEAAQAWAHADAYMRDGVFSSVTAKPFRRVLPA